MAESTDNLEKFDKYNSLELKKCITNNKILFSLFVITCLLGLTLLFIGLHKYKQSSNKKMKNVFIICGSISIVMSIILSILTFTIKNFRCTNCPDFQYTDSKDVACSTCFNLKGKFNAFSQCRPFPYLLTFVILLVLIPICAKAISHSSSPFKSKTLSSSQMVNGRSVYIKM